MKKRAAIYSSTARSELRILRSRYLLCLQEGCVLTTDFSDFPTNQVRVSREKASRGWACEAHPRTKSGRGGIGIRNGLQNRGPNRELGVRTPPSAPCLKHRSMLPHPVKLLLGSPLGGVSGMCGVEHEDRVLEASQRVEQNSRRTEGIG